MMTLDQITLTAIQHKPEYPNIINFFHATK
jgi:hypothetical protein